MLRRAIAVIVVAMGTHANAEERSVFGLYDHFTIAQVVGEACTGPTQDQATAFVAKFEALGALAEAEALATNPDLTVQSFKQFSARRRHSLQASVSEFLSVEGCNHAEAKALAAKYVEFRDMDLTQ
ncbi:MAG: hypothetical protein AAGH68_15365 [Pseudomonadota bacterium]